jgi:hypothetical protein
MAIALRVSKSEEWHHDESLEEGLGRVLGE